MNADTILSCLESLLCSKPFSRPTAYASLRGSGHEMPCVVICCSDQHPSKVLPRHPPLAPMLSPGPIALLWYLDKAEEIGNTSCNVISRLLATEPLGRRHLPVAPSCPGWARPGHITSAYTL